MNFASHRMRPQFPEMFKWLCRMSVLSWVICYNYKRSECDPIFLSRNTNLLHQLQIPNFHVGVALVLYLGRPAYLVLTQKGDEFKVIRVLLLYVTILFFR